MFNAGLTNKTAYKVIRPFTSQKLHFASSLEGGASKCYREVKTLMPNSTDFSVMNMTTNELYDYKLNKTINQSGGILPSLDIKNLEDKIQSLENRIKTLENMNQENKIDKKIDFRSEKNIQPSEKNIQPSEKNIQASPKVGGNKFIQPGPNVHSDFAKAFL